MKIAVVILSSNNKLFQYATTDMDKVLLKYTGTELQPRIYSTVEKLYRYKAAATKIAVAILRFNNKLFQYASTDMDKVLLKYTCRPAATDLDKLYNIQV
jgi:hypothetical protein